MSRYWAAMQNSAQIDLMIRTPQLRQVIVQDIVKIGDIQYKIKQIQYPPDVEPASMDLSLERISKSYPIPEEEDEQIEP